MLVAAAPSVARADDRALREAQARFEEGLKRVKAGDFEAARMSFGQAYVVLRKPDILWNLALSEEKSGHLLDALAHFKDFAKQAAVDTEFLKAQKHVDALMAQTGHIEVQAPAGTPVSLDGVTSVGTAPLAEPLDVAPGHHVIEGKLEGGTKTLGVDAVAGEVARVSFVVAGPDRPAPAPPPPVPDGAPPAAAVAPLAGSASSAPPADAWAGEDTRSRRSAARLATATAIGGGAVIAVGLGVYFGLQAQAEANTAADFRSSKPSSYCVNPANTGCAQWNDAVQTQNRDAIASDVLYVAGGVLAAGAVAAWLFWPKGGETTGASLWVVPAAGPAGGGVMAGGRF